MYGIILFTYSLFVFLFLNIKIKIFYFFGAVVGLVIYITIFIILCIHYKWFKIGCNACWSMKFIGTYFRVAHCMHHFPCVYWASNDFLGVHLVLRQKWKHNLSKKYLSKKMTRHANIFYCTSRNNIEA